VDWNHCIVLYNDAAYVSASEGSNQVKLPPHPHDPAVMGWGWGRCAMKGGDGDSMQQTVQERVGDSRRRFWHATQDCVTPYVDIILHRGGSEPNLLLLGA